MRTRQERTGQTFTVYLVTNTVNGKRYVGMTGKSAAERWADHQHAAKSNSRYLLHRAIRKHGAEAFEVEELAVAFCAETAFQLERTLVAMLDTYGWGKPGYNMTAGGDGVARKWSEEEKAIAKVRQKRSMSRPEVRAKISRAKKGKPGWGKGCKKRPESVIKSAMARTELFITYNGETLSASEWSSRTGIERRLISTRITKLGWSASRALCEPPKPRWTEEEVALLGTMPDSKVAVMLGKTKQSVTGTRRWHGIAAWRKVSASGTSVEVRCKKCGATFSARPSESERLKHCDKCKVRRVA